MSSYIDRFMERLRNDPSALDHLVEQPTDRQLKMWQERVADDPDGSIERLAERRGLTVEQLKMRHELIVDMFADGGGPDYVQRDDGCVVFFQAKRYWIDYGTLCAGPMNMKLGDTIYPKHSGEYNDDGSKVMIKPKVSVYSEEK